MFRTVNGTTTEDDAGDLKSNPNMISYLWDSRPIRKELPHFYFSFP